MKLLLTRHGETDHNLNRRYQGQMDVTLNQTGILQARQLAKRLSTEKIDTVIASDLSRTVETAKIIQNAQGGVTSTALSASLAAGDGGRSNFNPPAIQTDPRWRELSFGKWEGLNHKEIEEQWQDEAKAWYTDIVHAVPPEGESLIQLSKRVGEALDDLKSNHKDETVLLVTHSGVIQTLMCLVLDVDLKRYWQFRVLQASLTVIRFHEAGGVIELFNDCSHLVKV
ncbi:MAG: alpha-ribazole phosphatase [Chloroflexi bacterium]|nr:alpha-ribazole phosphatase [Chloroflexota bacterium]